MSSSNNAPSAPSANFKRAPRGGGGRGRGRGGGRRPGRGRGRGRSNDRNSNNDNNNDNNNNGSSNSINGVRSDPNDDALVGMTDEEILISFMPYLKGDNQEAMTIHERYQTTNDQRAFLKAARDFLSKEKRPTGSRSRSNSSVASAQSRASETPSTTGFSNTLPPSTTADGLTVSATFSNQTGRVPSNPFSSYPPPATSDPRGMQSTGPMDGMESLERDMMGLIADDDPIVEMPGVSKQPATIGGPAIGKASATRYIGSSMFNSNPSQANAQTKLFSQHTQPMAQFHQTKSQPITPPRPALHPGHIGPGTPVTSSSFSALFASTNNNIQSPFIHSQLQRSYSPHPPGGASGWEDAGVVGGTRNVTRNTATPEPSIGSLSFAPPPAPATETPKIPAKSQYQPKRLWTRLEEQPGKILANNVAASMGTVVDLHPREELKAQWALPLSYLRHHRAQNNANTQIDSARDLLAGLAVGLFRRGCTENGSQASIVSKEILAPPGESRSDYPFQVMKDAIVGTVPFFSPRTPGHVVFRLYWQDEPLHTLATGPTLNVRVTERDFESSIRFILSNFKAKKVNPTSLSSLNSLALVLEQFQFPPSFQEQRMAQQLEGAGRAVWGCICEARKVLDACSTDYEKTTAKLAKLEETVDELKVKVEEEGKENAVSDKGSSDGEDTLDEEPSETVLAYREKYKNLMSGRASCERKWRDSQLAFASILKAVVGNPSLSVILRRDLVSKLRLEYELWCPLSEEFAVPGEAEEKMWYDPLNNLPHNVNADHFRFCMDARSKLQQRSLGFDPNTVSLEEILYPDRNRSRQMNSSAVNVFNQLSAAMGKLYQENYATADSILRLREMIRLRTESLVNACECFPAGTKVAIFGSSANGFGSPKSDLDMCLQIPPGQDITSEDDPTGSLKMAKLAKILEENEMKEVDTARLTARIPVIKFNCPKPLIEGSDGEEVYMECDLSMHNPLAVLNTSLLRTYAEINPVPRVLAGVIKRWAIARDINNPAKHTLSSYGYILMLLHFLTFHQRSGNGLVVAASKQDKKYQGQNQPLLPNLQWMDSAWPEMQPGTSYKEFAVLPNNSIKHPLEERTSVNAYFYRPNATMLQNLQRIFPGQDLSLGILLASFFRYYAYEFDYKRYVVSLHSTLTYGLVEREVKAELDGWRNYSAALTIEDPFETFYDVAHVLRGGYYHRIRREFAVAYSKIADVASGKTSGIWNGKPVDLTKMVGMELIDWICEPVADRDDVSSQR